MFTFMLRIKYTWHKNEKIRIVCVLRESVCKYYACHAH